MMNTERWKNEMKFFLLVLPLLLLSYERADERVV
jgi:hypothetical protein